MSQNKLKAKENNLEKLNKTNFQKLSNFIFDKECELNNIQI